MSSKLRLFKIKTPIHRLLVLVLPSHQSKYNFLSCFWDKKEIMINFTIPF